MRRTRGQRRLRRQSSRGAPRTRDIRDAGWLQRTLVRARGCEDSESDFLEDDAELAGRGGAFLFLFAPSEDHLVRALAIFAQHPPVFARRYLDASIERIVAPAHGSIT